MSVSYTETMKLTSHSFAFITLVSLCVFLAPSVGQAGFIEVGASGSYRRANIDENSFDEARSLTGSLSYYFSEASALELSYTDGQNKRVIGDNSHVTSMYYTLIGLDFVYTIGGRESAFRPYVKAGANYIVQKRIVDQYRLSDGSYNPATIIEEDPALVPSAGVGFKMAITQQLSIKVGVDAWSSRPLNKEPVQYDYAGRVGLSLMF